MKKIALLLILLLFTTVACDVSVSLTPTANVPAAVTIPVKTIVPEVPATSTPIIAFPATLENPTAIVPTEVIPTATQNQKRNTLINCSSMTLEIPYTVASGAVCNNYPREDSSDLAWWQKNPGYAQINFTDSFAIRGKTNQAVINLYDAMAYVEMAPAAFESIHRLDNYLYGGQTISNLDQVPNVPFYNSNLLFAANIKKLDFQNGSGIRFLTQYAQSPVPANNSDLFYNFIGVSADGNEFIIIILPVTSPYLSETSDGNASVPNGGIVYPYLTDPSADLAAYYSAVTDLLNTQSPENFTPGLGEIDTMIQSLFINK